MAIDEKGMWSYGSHLPRNGVIFSVSHTSLSHSNNNKKSLFSIR